MKKTITTLALSALLATSIPMLFAQTNVSATTTKKVKTIKKVDVLCLQNAIEKRDSTLITGLNTENTSLVAAMTARKDSLKSAISLSSSTQIQAARKNAQSSFKTSVKSAHEAMKDTRMSSWSTYKTEAKACGSTAIEAPMQISSEGAVSL